MKIVNQHKLMLTPSYTKKYTLDFQGKISIYDDLIDSFIDKICDFDFLN